MPPVHRNSEQVLDDLAKLQEWTEQPVKDAVSAITPAVQLTANPAEAFKPPAARFPWEESSISAPEAVKLVNFKIPMRLYLKLKYLGDTTYDSSMTKIVVSTLEKETDRLLKERQS